MFSLISKITKGNELINVKYGELQKGNLNKALQGACLQQCIQQIPTNSRKDLNCYFEEFSEFKLG